MDTGASGYAFIDTQLAHQLSKDFNLPFMPLLKVKAVQAYDGVSRKPITHALYLTLTIRGRRTHSAPMLITDLGRHQLIIGLPWMVTERAFLDCEARVVRFLPQGLHWSSIMAILEQQASPSDAPASTSKTLPREPTPRATATLAQTPRPRGIEVPLPKPIKASPRSPANFDEVRRNLDEAHRIPPKEKEDLQIAMVGAAGYIMAAKTNNSKHQADTFVTSVKEIDEAIRQMDPDSVELNEVAPSPSAEDLQRQVPKYLHDFLDVFDRRESKELPPYRDDDHRIELTKPVEELPKTKLRNMGYHKAKKVKEYLEENLDRGFIVPSKAAYASPILFAQKKDGSLRFCVDYRGLNEVTKKNRYPLPLINETMAKVSGCRHLTKIDIIAAFNRIRMHPDSEEFTAFITAFGMYQSRVLPFGLSNGPASWQHYINKILFDYLDKFCQAYVDDILIYSKSRKEHHEHVRLVMQKLREAGLQADIRKCEFDVEETRFLGVIINGNGIKMDPEKVATILAWDTPSNLKQTQGFLGFCNFYRKFIKGFSKIASPLTQLSKKDKAFEWNDQCQQAFELLKKRCTEAPVLRHFDPDLDCILEVDSSDTVNGGVLSQRDAQGEIHPVAFYSHSLDPAERNYDIYDKELLAIIKALEYWQDELEATDEPIKIFTDHKNLEYFMSTKKLSRRQARWSEIMSRYNFKIVYRPGKQNMVADALTRRGDADPLANENEKVLLPPDKFDLAPIEPEEQPEDPQDVGAQPAPRARSIWASITQANTDNADFKKYRIALRRGTWKDLDIDLSHSRSKNKVLYKGDRLWVPPSEVTSLVKRIHNQPSSGHPGIRRTLGLVERYYYWPTVRSDVKQYIRNCHTCRRTKAPRDKYNGFLRPLPVPEQRWKDIGIDFIVGLPECEGKNAILTVIDRLSKDRKYIPVRCGEEGCSAEETAKLLKDHVWSFHGLPSSITSDRAKAFISAVWKALCRRLGIDSNPSSSYHPETDGQTERANQDCKQSLRALVNYHQNDWVDHLPISRFQHANLESAATGMTPFFFNNGYHPRMNFSPDEKEPRTVSERVAAERAAQFVEKMEAILEFGRKNDAEAKERMAIQANRHRRDISYKIGDWVWLSTKDLRTDRPCKSLDYKFIGPYQIIAEHNGSYELDLPGTLGIEKTHHSKKLRPEPNDPLPGQYNDPPPPLRIEEGEPVHGIERIVGSRYRFGLLQYKVKWEGYEQDDVWYRASEGQFDDAPEAIRAYFQQNQNADGAPDGQARRRPRRQRI